jgi:uncharacterized protein YjbJ (UPF0337 family)
MLRRWRPGIVLTNRGAFSCRSREWLLPVRGSRTANERSHDMNRDQVKGRIDQAKGKVKEEAGDLMDDKSTEVEGKIEKNIGRGQAEAGDMEERLKREQDKR